MEVADLARGARRLGASNAWHAESAEQLGDRRSTIDH